MRQALHIFKKDVRLLWFQIVLLLAATAMFAYTDASPWAWLPNYVPPLAFNAKPLISPDADRLGDIAFSVFSDASMLSELLVLAWCCLIALVVHAEAIPGDRQFWLTRPYDRQSLWGAKALFVLAFVNLPLFVAQAAIISMDGFTVVSNLSGLLWEQVLVTAVITIPAMAAATLTRKMTQFAFLLFIAAFAASGFAIMFMFPLLPFDAPWYLEGRRMGSLNWLQDSVGIAAVGATAFAIVFLQYTRRRTSRTRLLAGTGAAVAFAAFWFVPWTPAFAVQSLLARSSETPVRAELNRPPSNLPRFGVSDTLDLPLRIGGLPAGTLLSCEAATVRVESASGAAWQSDVIHLYSRISQTPDGCRVRANIDHAFFNTNRSRPVRIRSELYLTVFGNERTTLTRPGAEPVNVPGVGVCRTALSEQRVPAVMCRSAFRLPRRLVWIRDDTGRGERLETMSYSPFPAELRISPVENSWARAFLNQSGDVTIVAQEPIAYVRTDVELGDVQLGDLEFGAR